MLLVQAAELVGLLDCFGSSIKGGEGTGADKAGHSSQGEAGYF